jgi:hypothetical protein
MSTKSFGSSSDASGSGSEKTQKATKPTSSSSGKSPKIPKLTLDSTSEDDTKTRTSSPLVRSVSQMLPSNLLPHSHYSSLTARGAPVRRVATPAALPGATASATFSSRIFITSDLTPHRFCALVVKPGWQWDDFLEAASAKLAGGHGGPNGPNTTQALSPANAIFLQNGSEIGSLDDLRDDDQVLLRFQKRMSVAPGVLNPIPAPAPSSTPNSEDPSTTVGEDSLISYIPMDGIFRVLLPELVDVSPLSFSDELIADLVQDELKQLSALDSNHTATTPEKISLRLLMRDLLLSSESLPEVILRTYDYLLPHHSFLSMLIVHFRAPLVPMEAGQMSTGGASHVRPQPPQGRATSALPTYGMSVQMTDPIRRGASQTRIINVIKQWIEIRFETISEDLASLELLDDLIVYLCASPDRLRAYGEAIAQTFKMARKIHSQTERDLDLCAQTLISKEKTTFTRAVDVSPFELACQLTLADQDKFLRMNLSELQAQQFDLTERNLSPHIVEWVRHSTFITSWVVASILGPPGEANPGAKSRALVLQHFLTAMDELRSMRSYNSMMQIYHALTHPAIDRLEATWEAVSPAHLTIKDSITQMIKPPSSQGYVNLIQSAEAPAIPYIEYHLNELRQIETNETILENGDINLAKLEKLSKAFRIATRLQQVSYNLLPNAAYMSFIRTYDVPAMTTLIELSLALESDVVNASAGSNGMGAAVPGGRIVVRPAARSISDYRTSSSSGGGAYDSAPGSGGLVPGKGNKAAAVAIKERKRKDSSAQKLVKEKEKEEEKRKKKWDKQSKKIKPLLTAALSVEQAILNNDIYEQFLSYSNDPSFLNALNFSKSVADWKKMFGSDAEPAARRTREEAAKIASIYLTSGVEKAPEFSSAVETQLRDIESRAKSDQGLFTNNIFDPLTADLLKMLGTSFVLFKAQRPS